MSAPASIFEKALSATYYKTQWSKFLVSSYNYYHPLMRKGSATPLWHMMVGVSLVMYTTSYMARDRKFVSIRSTQWRRIVGKLAYLDSNVFLKSLTHGFFFCLFFSFIIIYS